MSAMVAGREVALALVDCPGPKGPRTHAVEVEARYRRVHYTSRGRIRGRTVYREVVATDVACCGRVVGEGFRLEDDGADPTVAADDVTCGHCREAIWARVLRRSA